MGLTRRATFVRFGATAWGVLGSAGIASAGLFRHGRRRQVYAASPAHAPCAPAVARLDVFQNVMACREVLTSTSFDSLTSFKLGTAVSLQVTGLNFARNQVSVHDLNPHVAWTSCTLSTVVGECTDKLLTFTCAPMGSAAASSGGLTVTVLPNSGGPCIAAQRGYAAGAIQYTL